MKANLKSILDKEKEEEAKSLPYFPLSLEIKDIDFFLTESVYSFYRLEEKKSRRRKGDINTVSLICKSESDPIEKYLSSLISVQDYRKQKSGYYPLFIAYGYLSKEDRKEPLFLIPVILEKKEKDWMLRRNLSEEIILNPNLNHLLNSYPVFNGKSSLLQYRNLLLSTLKNNSEIHYFDVIRLGGYDLFAYYRHQSLNSFSEKDIDSLLNRFRQKPKAKAEDGENYLIKEEDTKSAEYLSGIRSGQSLVLFRTPGSDFEDFALNLAADSICREKNLLILASNPAQVRSLNESFGTIGLKDYCLPLFSDRLNETICYTDKKTAEKPIRDAIFQENKKRLDEYSYALSHKERGYERSANDLYRTLSECQDVPVLEDESFDISDFDETRFQITINILSHLQNDLMTFGKDYGKSSYSNFTLPENKTSKDFIRVLDKEKKNVENIKSILLLIYPERDFSTYYLDEVKELFSFLQKFYKLTILEPDFFLSSKRKTLVSKITELLPMIAIEQNLKRNIKSLAIDDILGLKNIQKIKDNFEKGYKQVFHRFSSSYRKDMQTLNEYALSPLSKEEAFELVRLVENYQVNHKKILQFLTRFKKQLSDQNEINESNYARFVEENLFYGNVKGDIPFLIGKDISEVRRIQKILPIRAINSVSFELNLSDYFDRKNVHFEKWDLKKFDGFLTEAIQQKETIDAYLAFRSHIEQAKKNHCLNFFQEYIKANVSDYSLADCFVKKYSLSLLEHIQEEYPVLKDFSMKDYEKCITGFEKEDEAFIHSNLIYLKEMASYIRSSIKNEYDAKTIKELKKEPLSYLLKNELTFLQRAYPIIITCPYVNNRYIKPETRFDQVAIFDDGSLPLSDGIIAMKKGKQNTVITVPDYSIFDEGKLNQSLSDYRRNRFLHTDIDSSILSFPNRQFFESSLISHPYFDKDPLRMKTFYIKEDTDILSIYKSIQSEISLYNPEKKDETISLIALNRKQKAEFSSFLKIQNDWHLSIYSLDEEIPESDTVFLSLYNAFLDSADNPFCRQDGRNMLLKALTSARKHLEVMDFKSDGKTCNKMGLPPSLRMLKEYLYSLRNPTIIENKESRQKKEIEEFLASKGYVFKELPDSSDRSSIVLFSSGRPYLILDFYSENQIKKNTYDRELSEKRCYRERGIRYLRILPSCYYSARKECLAYLLNSIKKIEKASKAKPTR